MTKITLVTHNGSFHPDDVFAVAALMLLYDNQISLIRTRDKKIIDAADIVVDVGMEYDPARKRFDHHQEGGAGSRENGIPYSSFGLMWQQYGAEICGSQEVSKDIDQRLVAYIDAQDNGIETTVRLKEDYPFRYSILDIVRSHRPTWEETGTGVFDASFLEAVELAKNILVREIKKLKSEFKAREYIRSVYEQTVDKRILILDPYAPWDKVVCTFPEPLFVVFPSLANKNEWVAKVVEDDPAIYTSNRISFPESWAGKREEDLKSITGVPGAIFAHRARFMVVANSKEAVLALVDLALKEAGK